MSRDQRAARIRLLDRCRGRLVLAGIVLPRDDTQWFPAAVQTLIDLEAEPAIRRMTAAGFSSWSPT
jgi:hypothetical protein